MPSRVMIMHVLCTLVESRKHKQVTLEEHRAKLDVLHNEMNIQRSDIVATEEAEEDQKKRRRMSLALRYLINSTAHHGILCCEC